MFKPLLAPNDDPMKNPNFWDFIHYPLLGSPKLDGIRNLTKEEMCMSRTFTPLPRMDAQIKFSGYENLDGELIVGQPTDGDLVYNRTQSYVMSNDERPEADLRYYVFDYIADDWLKKPFIERLAKAHEYVASVNSPILLPVKHVFITSYEELLAFEDTQLELGYEGLMLRNPYAAYKCGRATMLQNIIYKLKRFRDEEALIIGFEEQMTNTNEDIRSNLGYAKRSKAKEGLVPAGTLGKFIVDWHGHHLLVGPGSFSHKDRQWIWGHREQILASLTYLKFRHFPKGMKDLPRHPRAVGFRSKIDMG